jgi:DNA-directed RNA polymerase
VTNAADMPLMHRVLRETLVELYREHPLEDLRQQLEERFGVKLPAPPTRGAIDLAKVLESEYAFS